MTEKEMLEDLKKILKPSRYEHSLGVMETAMDLAKKYNGNVEKARLAGLLHDCAKCMSHLEITNIAQKYNISLDFIIKNQMELAHGPIGAVLLEKKYGIYDKEIYNAIYYHTTGRKNMGLLEKIIYLADYIEPNRDFPGVQELRELAKINLEEAIFKAMNNTIQYVLSLNGLIHPYTIEGRNDILLNLKEKSQ